MKTYCLRAIFEISNVGFTEECVLLRGPTEVRLIKQRKLPSLATPQTTGVSPNGKLMVSMQAIEKLFTGKPLLVEITATSDYPDNATPMVASTELEGRISETEAVLSWSLPYTIGPKLATALFNRSEGDPPNTWNWEEASVIHVGEYYASVDIVSHRCTNVQTAIHTMPSPQQELTLSALRWWRYGLNVETPPDKLIAHWILVESSASALSSGGSIAVKVLNALTQVYPELAKIEDGKRIKQLRDFLYRSRCKAVHAGKRDFKHPEALAQLAETVAADCIRLLIDKLPSKNPSDDLLNNVYA